MSADKFVARLAAAREQAGAAADGDLFYRRAVATEARRLRPPPAAPVPGLFLAANGVAVLTMRPLDASAVDDALLAARTAGAEWAVAWVTSPEDVAVLRALEFLPIQGR